MAFPSPFLITLAACVLFSATARADKLTLRDPTGERRIEGNVLGTDSTGATLFETRDGRHLVVPKDKLVRLDRSKAPTPLFTKSELKASLAEEFGEGFRVTEANNYLIVHSGPAENAREAGRLLYRAQNAFHTFFWKNHDFKLVRSKQPLIAVLFEGRKQYVEHVSRYVGPTASMTLGVYIPSVNRIFLYNAFGGDVGRQIGVAKEINPAFARQMAGQILDQNISTLVHEAVHQAAYNTGFHNRKVVDYPLWLLEGMAMYFETTDVNGHGWKGGRSVNAERAAQFKAAYRRGLGSGFLERLIVDDAAMRDPASAADSYALSWTLTFYLLKHHKTEYMEYVRLINARPEFTPYPRASRLKDFEIAFKTTPRQLESQFLDGVMKLLDR
jgi:hypothetical protein